MTTQQLFIQASLQFLNIPYFWGGDDPIKGLDCSGLVQELYAMIGIDPPGDQTAQGLYNHFKSISRNYSIDEVEGGQVPTGALAFYGKDAVKGITHVAVFLNDKLVIEAGGGGSKTTSEEAAIAQNAFIRIRPWNHRKDCVAVIAPDNLPWTRPT